MKNRPSSKPPHKNTVEIEISQEQKEEIVNRFLAERPADRCIIRDMAAAQLAGSLDNAFNLLKAKYGLEIHRVDNDLQQLCEACGTDYDEVVWMLQEQLGPETEGNTVEMDPDGLERTVERPREEVRAVLRSPKDPMDSTLYGSESEGHDVIKAAVQQTDTAPFTKKGLQPGRQMTVSPWDARKAASATPPAQASVILPEEEAVECREAAPFVRQRNPHDITVSSWQGNIGTALQEEVAPFYERFMPEAKALLQAVLNAEDTEDPQEVKRVIREYAPGATEDSFHVMDRSVSYFSKKLGRPEMEVRKALGIKLEGGGRLSEPEIREGLDPRQQPTILSNSKQQRGILERILRKNRKRKK